MNNIPAGIIILDKGLTKVKFANEPFLSEIDKFHSTGNKLEKPPNEDV